MTTCPVADLGVGWMGSFINKNRRKRTGERHDRRSAVRLRLRRHLCALLSAMMFTIALTGCGSVVFVSGLEGDELFSVGTQNGSRREFVVYLTTLENQYKETYGEDVFTRAGNETVGESLKENALELLVKVKALNEIAEGMELASDETDEALARQAMTRWMDSLSDADRAYLDITQNEVLTMYLEYDLALQAAEALIADIDTEVSDDEARTVTVQSILIKTYTTDADGNRVEFTESEKAEAKARAEAIRQEIQDGMDNLLGITFVSWMAEYNEDSVTTYTFGRGEVDSAFEEAAFNQAVGTISDVVETEDGYRIIKTISISDDAETLANKEAIAAARAEAAYEETYDALVSQMDYNLSKERWAQITLCDDPEVTTSNFFAVYNEVFEADG